MTDPTPKKPGLTGPTKTADLPKSRHQIPEIRRFQSIINAIHHQKRTLSCENS
jgi:hypothetical protein